MSLLPRGAAAATARYLSDRLTERFGFSGFRPGQLEAVKSAMAGRDVLAVMPTGSGKTLCFQLPALELEGTTVVVSPLIALMKDQADALRNRGVVTAVINSTLSATERRRAEDDIASGKAEFVYTTPEQIAAPEFRAVLRKQKTDLFVVDEAHCVSQWGHDFRPEYLTLWEAVEDLGRPPVLALTATATKDVAADIVARLRMPDAVVIQTGFYRDNIRPAVLPAVGDRAKRQALLDVLPRLDGTGIVYAATTKAVDDVADFLQSCGVAAEAYHGKMSAKDRAAAQDRFMAGNLRVLVATNAFGLGIDKPDIRFVIHYHAPGTMEAFYQEFGRAGRDGEPADAVLLYDPADLKLQRFFAGGRYPDDGDLVNAYHALARFADRAEAPTLAELQAVSPVPKAKLRVCVDLLGCKGVVRREPDGRLRLVRQKLSRDEVVRAGSDYRKREQRDQEKLARMAEYAGRKGCRWRSILDYFEDDEDTPVRCGHCDYCD